MIQTVTPCYLKEKLLIYEMSKLVTTQECSGERTAQDYIYYSKCPGTGCCWRTGCPAERVA